MGKRKHGKLEKQFPLIGPDDSEINHMKIRWTNLIALALVIVAIVLVSRSGRELSAVIDTMDHIGPSYSHQEQTRGLLVLGLIGVIIVAVVRIVVSGQNARGQDSSHRDK